MFFQKIAEFVKEIGFFALQENTRVPLVDGIGLRGQFPGIDSGH